METNVEPTRRAVFMDVNLKIVREFCRALRSASIRKVWDDPTGFTTEKPKWKWAVVVERGKWL